MKKENTLDFVKKKRKRNTMRQLKNTPLKMKLIIEGKSSDILDELPEIIMNITFKATSGGNKVKWKID